jgi:hypothetical protein
MKPGSIVIVLHDLDWIDDHCEQGTRLRLLHVRETSAGPRWSGRTKDGRTHHNIPPDAIEVIA